MAEHTPVLLDEVLAGLSVRPDGRYCDATFGRGGHTAAILGALGPAGRLVAIDRDPEAIRAGRQRFAAEARLTLVQGSFGPLEERVRRSTRPGRSSAESSTSARLVAASTMMPSRGSKPSISVRI